MSAAGKLAAAPKLPLGALVYALGPPPVCKGDDEGPRGIARGQPRRMPAASTAGVLQVLLPAGSLLVYTEVTPLGLVCCVTLNSRSPAPSIAIW